MRRALVAFAILAGALLGTTSAFADATPVQLMLLYMPNVSNTDTPSASGIAELVMQEGEVRLEAAGLPHLEGAERYQAWLVNSRSNQFYALGGFNANGDDESIHFEDVLPDAIPNKQWDLLLVTIETSAAPARPSAKHSIAGTFPRSDRDPAPALLPNTGGLDEGSAVSGQWSVLRFYWQPVAVLAALALSVGLGAGYGLGLRKR